MNGDAASVARAEALRSPYGRPGQAAVEPDEHGTRAQRRRWQQLYGKRHTAATGVEETDLPCCTPMDEAHTLPNGHTVFCRDEMNRERS